MEVKLKNQFKVIEINEDADDVNKFNQRLKRWFEKVLFTGEYRKSIKEKE
jgi:hypothetical protein